MTSRLFTSAPKILLTREQRRFWWTITLGFFAAHLLSYSFTNIAPVFYSELGISMEQYGRYLILSFTVATLATPIGPLLVNTLLVSIGWRWCLTLSGVSLLLFLAGHKDLPSPPLDPQAIHKTKKAQVTLGQSLKTSEQIKTVAGIDYIKERTRQGSQAADQHQRNLSDFRIFEHTVIYHHRMQVFRRFAIASAHSKQPPPYQCAGHFRHRLRAIFFP